MGIILKYELKKILKRKITGVTFFLLLLIQIFVAFSGKLGSTYADGKFVETHAKRNQIDRKNGIALSGRPIDDQLLEELQQAYAKIQDTDSDLYLLSERYQNEVRPYSELYTLIQDWVYGTDSRLQNLTEEELYQIRKIKLDAAMESYKLTSGEISYWENKNSRVEEPLTYQYSTSYSFLIRQGIYMISLILTFFLAICLSSVFHSEHTGKTDQLILCTRNGRAPLYLAKILAGCIVDTGACALFSAITVIGSFISFGPEGFDAMIQITTDFCYPYPLSSGQAFLIMLGILFLSSLLIGIFTMILAELLHNSLGSMAVILGGIFAARLVLIPNSLRPLSQLWNYIPINLLATNQGFLDLRLVSIGELRMTSWQFAPILYLLLIILMLIAGKHVYCRSQIDGR